MAGRERSNISGRLPKRPGGLVSIGGARNSLAVANHICDKRDGIVTLVGTTLRTRRRGVVWDACITDVEECLICVSRCMGTVMPR